jgi:dipeptidyl-peptidase-4
MAPSLAARLRVGVVCALLGVAVAAEAQQKPLALDAIYDPQARVDFSGNPPTDVTWLDDTHYLLVRRASGGRGSEWLKVDAATGRTDPLFDVERMATALAAIPGVTRDEALALVRRAGNLTLNPSNTAALLTLANDLFLYDFGSGRATRLTSTPDEEELATFSPDGRLVAFVRSNNLFVVETATPRERAITSDGTADILNGKLDWVYQEEIYGRGEFRAYWWSPDSSRLAFLQLNDGPVPRYTVVDHIPYHPTLEVTPYPKAGDPNPLVKLAVARVVGGEPQWMDLSAYSPIEFLIVKVGWTPGAKQLVYQVQDREQTWLDLNVADPTTGKPTSVLRETTKAWVNENGNPVWLKDGSFLWLSERTGFKHLYHYKADGAEIRQITSGRWDVRALYGVHESSGTAYFSGTERGPLGVDVYRAKLDGSGMTRLSGTAGTHRAVFSPGFSQYVDVWSNVTTPPQVRLHKADGTEQRVIDANPVKALSEYRLARPEFLQVKTRDGFVMEAMMIKPPDFNPARRYPVYQFTYAGPGAQQVRDAWGGSGYMFHQLLAQQGLIVWIIDNRSASGKGVESQWPVYGRLGELELQDIEDGVAWLKQQPYVDGSRIALSGWSYGGFMTAYALTHSTSFAAGIVGAPVTDWRDYDSIYTERFMKMPQHNPDGYRRTAPRWAADALHGRMLLMHGTTDDNVHMQNSVQFAYELQKVGKPFEVMIYPKSRHAVTDSQLVKHLRQTMFDFVMRTVGSAVTAAPTASR